MVFKQGSTVPFITEWAALNVVFKTRWSLTLHHWIGFTTARAHPLVCFKKAISNFHCILPTFQTCNECRKDMGTSLVCQSFLHRVTSLLTSIAKCMEHVLPSRPTDFPAKLAQEWTEFFSQGAYSILLPIYISLTGKKF